MNAKPPRRYKTHDELTVDEHVQVLQSDRRRGPGEEKRFETEEYRSYRAEVLRAAGLEDEDDDAAPRAR